MNKRISAAIFLIVLTCALFSPLAVWLIHPTPGQYSLIETRPLTDLPILALDFQQVKTGVKRIAQGQWDQSWALLQPQLAEVKEFAAARGSYQKGSADQFPLRLALIRAARWFERAFIQTAYAPLPDPIIPASRKADVLVLRSQPVLLRPPADFDDSLKQGIDRRIKNIEQVITENPDVTFYAYFIETLNRSPYHPSVPYYALADQGRSLAYFEAHKPEKLIFGKQVIASFDDYLKNFYHTDHHWNENGAWQGYLGVYDLVAPYYPGMSPRLEAAGFTTAPGANFCGSFARESLYPCTPDPFRYAEISLPPYTTIVDGVPQALGDPASFKNDTFSKEPYTELRVAYWGPTRGVVEYHFDNDATRNVILFGDSNTNSLDPLIGSHYHLAISLDPRHMGKFSLKEWIQKYNIDDVIIIGSPSVFFTKTFNISP